MDTVLPADLGLDLVRATEAAAIIAGRWMWCCTMAKKGRFTTSGAGARSQIWRWQKRYWIDWENPIP